MNDTIGSLKDGDRYYFILGGKQRVCRPVNKNCQKVQTTKGGRPKKKQGRFVENERSNTTTDK